LAYTLTAGLDLGVPYPVPGYPTGNNSGAAVQDSPGPLRPTGFAISRGSSIERVRPRFMRSPPRSAGAAIRAPIQTSWS
jgi:hypothetical protein